MGRQASASHERGEGRAIDEQRLALIVVVNCHAVQRHRRLESAAEGLAECLLRGKALGQKRGRLTRSRKSLQFPLREYPLGRPLTVTFQETPDARDVHDIRTDSVDHVGLDAIMISFIRRTALCQPLNIASATMAWPMFSSLIAAIAATPCTFP